MATFKHPSVDTVSAQCRKLIACDADAVAKYDSAHTLLSALLGGLHRAGWTFDEASALCLDISQPLGRMLLDEWGEEVVSRQLSTKWHAAERKHLQSAQTIAEWVNVVVEHWADWRSDGRLRVALALAHLALRTGHLTFTASSYEIGEIAGVGYATSRASALDADTTTVRKALARLESDGYCTIERSDSRDHFETGQRITLTEPDKLSSLLAPAPAPAPAPKPRLAVCTQLRGVKCALDVWLHPAFEHNGLGMAACLVWVILQERPLGRAEIVARARLSPRGVSKVLHRLSTEGLAERRDGCWIWHDRPLEDVAISLKVHARGSWRAAANSAKRDARKTAFDRWVPLDQAAPDEIGPFDDDWIERDGRLVNTMTGEIRRPPTVGSFFIAPSSRECRPALAAARSTAATSRSKAHGCSTNAESPKTAGILGS